MRNTAKNLLSPAISDWLGKNSAICDDSVRRLFPGIHFSWRQLFRVFMEIVASVRTDRRLSLFRVAVLRYRPSLLTYFFRCNFATDLHYLPTLFRRRSTKSIRWMDGSIDQSIDWPSESSLSLRDESEWRMNELHRRTRERSSERANEGKEKKRTDRVAATATALYCALWIESIGRLLVGDTLF